MREAPVVVIGAGIGGLAAAAELAARGRAVIVLEAQSTPGGKLREIRVGETTACPVYLDGGPTVFTMRWVFEELFEALGTSLSAELELRPATILARHAWHSARLDLFADIDHSADAIGDFAGARDAAGYRRLCADSRQTFERLDGAFIRAYRPSLLGLIGQAGLLGLRHIRPFSTLWQVLGGYFQDQRLRQLFARYATYCGSSPFAAPATLLLVTHVEQAGVWLVEGGMHRLAKAIETQALRHGARFHYNATVQEIEVAGGRVCAVRLASGERVAAASVIANTDSAALAAGRLGAAAKSAVPAVPVDRRSLSAITFAIRTEARGFPLVRHNVFFSDDYAAEFRDIFGHHRLPLDPTVYVCAQDRDGDDTEPSPDCAERLLCLVNAPARGDSAPLTVVDIDHCTSRLQRVLARSGLQIAPAPEAMTVTTPTAFDRLFPATGGALYGAASHGWQASFQRPGVTTKLPGLYLAGGSVHPGPGVPMATLSGRMAAAQLMADR